MKDKTGFHGLSPPIYRNATCPGKDIPREVILGIEESGLFMGLEENYGNGYYVGKKAEHDGNVLVTGINGSGKSLYLAKSIIETWRDPFVVLDCKGELSAHYEYLLRHGRARRKYTIFNPTDNSVRYDPFAILKKEDNFFNLNAREIAYAIIPTLLNDPNSYWRNMARDLLTAIIIFGFSIGLDFIETMKIAVHYPVWQLTKKISQSDFETARGYINDIAGLEKKNQALIGTDMKQHLMVFATDPCVQAALSNTDGARTFSWDEIATTVDAPNVFLRLDQDRLEQWSGMSRLMITQFIRTLERRPDKHSPQGHSIKPILLLLDEFPLLGKLEPITNALTTLRSKKVTFCLMIQSIAQLDAIYGSDVRKIIVDNCQYKLILKVTEPDSQEYFSRLIGTVPTSKRNISLSFDPWNQHSTFGAQMQEFREPLIFPHQFTTNNDIWLHTPWGFLAAFKQPVTVIRQSIEIQNDIKSAIQEARRRLK